MSHEIFISYRRSDSAAFTGRIFDHIESAFGRDSVFKDVDSIGPGDFRKQIREALDACRVVLVIIGPDWIDARDEHGDRRIDGLADHVRLEIATAVARVEAEQAILIPLFVEGARVPRLEQLPPDLADLIYQNGFPVRHDPDFRSDVERVIRMVRIAVDRPGTAPHGPPSVSTNSNSPSAKAPSTRPRTDDFRKALARLTDEARRAGRKHLDVNSGDLHRLVGGYPDGPHAMPSCCNAMRKAMKEGDAVLASPPKGNGASLTIRYFLDAR